MLQLEIYQNIQDKTGKEKDNYKGRFASSTELIFGIKERGR